MYLYSEIITPGAVEEVAGRLGIKINYLTKELDWVRVSISNGSGGFCSYDETGVFVNELYQLDPDMLIPAPFYGNYEDFRWVQFGRFDQPIPAGAHRIHLWGESVLSDDGVFFVRECACSAKFRYRNREAS
jgi:hypothetical protein